MCPVCFSNRYVNRVLVHDLAWDQKWYFLCNSWLAIDIGECVLDKVFPVATEQDMKQFRYLLFYGLFLLDSNQSRKETMQKRSNTYTKMKTREVLLLPSEGSEQGKEEGWLSKSNHYPNSNTTLEILVLKKDSLTRPTETQASSLMCNFPNNLYRNCLWLAFFPWCGQKERT